MLTHVPVTGNVDDSGGCRACLSLAPMEKRTCGPPGGGICEFLHVNIRKFRTSCVIFCMWSVPECIPRYFRSKFPMNTVDFR